ncbi:hypothetical protein Rhe02_42400 [Rhizocola hellebori]|uniref:Uncharacterized protein n=1 Tax=Rhizocola hellebori TaxID=1392758 RepID=A0A8J3QAI6_9ACTN|nr:hypothetical protein [Rhizocola hellebori]GIH06173.1 hypothetical protein Rhe02_42400 [Rhizocola hellebori]
MRMPSPRFLIGLGLVLAVSVGTAYFLTKPQEAKPAEPISVACVGGSEKSELMADESVRRVLKEKFGITVTFSPLGSYDQVQLSADELRKRKLNCLWPGSASAQSVFESLHRGEFPQYRAETVLQSPEVIYAGPNGTDALVREGIVAQRDGKHYVVDMKRLLLEFILKGKAWDSVKAKGLSGPIKVASTDPAKSNSGFTMTQLELTIVATADVFKAPNLAEAKAALPTLRALYDAQGLQAASSDFGFRQWLTQGAELSSPLYAGYENQIIQLVAQQGPAALKEVRVLYPEPTIYNDHPILALDGNGERFLQAMKDREIQTIAWKKYGMRSSVHLDLNNVTDFKDLPLAVQFRTTPPPNAEVTLALLGCLNDARKCS